MASCREVIGKDTIMQELKIMTRTEWKLLFDEFIVALIDLGILFFINN